ncbi:DUF2849 domain-containing protein [Alphaproteobacteria bacterium]|jgi:hypothetical protein|nr:DUF2849 domain-containing protein [Alphaproteobacteria bacterium]
MAQHVSKGARFQAVTANRLSDGEVIYFAGDNGWTENFQTAKIADGAEASKELLQAAMTDDFELLLLEPYLFEVIDAGNANFNPASVREVIRAAGPTIRLDLGKQAEA